MSIKISSGPEIKPGLIYYISIRDTGIYPWDLKKRGKKAEKTIAEFY